jgi:MFS family permease
MGSGIAATGFMHNLGFGIMAMLVVGMMMTMVDIPIIIYIQTVSDPKMLGRVMSLLSLTSMGLGPVSYALTSFILQHGIADAQTVMITGGTLMAITGLSIMLFRDFRTMEEHPSWKIVGSQENKNVEGV